MAGRSPLLKLQRSGLIRLPPSLRLSVNGQRNRISPSLPACIQSIDGILHDLQSLKVSIVIPRSAEAMVFQALLVHEHYLALCNSHLLHDFPFLWEEEPQA